MNALHVLELRGVQCGGFVRCEVIHHAQAALLRFGFVYAG